MDQESAAKRLQSFQQLLSRPRQRAQDIGSQNKAKFTCPSHSSAITPLLTKRKQTIDQIEERTAKRQHLHTPSPTPSASEGLAEELQHQQQHQKITPHEHERSTTPVQEKVDVSTQLGHSHSVHRSVPSPRMPPPGRLRSNSPDEILARKMVHPDNDTPSDKDNYHASLIWTSANLVPDPQDPLDLGVKCRALHDANPNVQNLQRINQAWLATIAQAENRDGSGKSITQEQYDLFQQEHRQAVAMYVAEQRHIQTHPCGSEVLLNPTKGPVELCESIYLDLEAGWRYPGGFNPMQQKRSVHTTFQHQMWGFKRDLFDNGFAYATMYPMGTHIIEKVGSDGEIFVSLGGQRFCNARVRMVEGDYNYVKREEVDWAEVAANGGMGDLVLIEDDVRKDEGEIQKNSRRPWVDRRTRYDTMVSESRH